MLPRSAALVVIVDSQDSFTWNLVHAVGMAGARVRVVQSADTTPADLMALGADRVVLGPGPGHPSEAGYLTAMVSILVRHRVPTLGVCLGMQAIALALGGKVVRSPPVHGRTSTIAHDGDGVFADLPDPVDMTRYHSLVVEGSSLPPSLRACAWAEDGTCMGLRHASAPVHGVQFHPESVLSGATGQKIVERFLALPQAPAVARRPPTYRAMRMRR